MNGPRTAFKRMVVGLPQGMANNAAVEAAVDLAESLQIELHATFVADSTLLALAELPAVRELRTLGQGWQSIDLEQITRDIDRAASAARRGFTESVKRRAIKTSFDVVAGAEAIAALIRADDIVAIIEPGHPAETITRQFTDLLDAALKSAAAVLTVPRRIVRTTGPILAVAAGPDDPSIGVALKIAAAWKERLIVVTRSRLLLPPEVRSDAEQDGVHVEQIVAGESSSNGSLLAPASRERLRVITRSRLSADARRLFSTLQGVPLLVVEPDQVERAVEQEDAR
jgi:hypothetical protein